MHILIAPNAFKNSLDANAVANAIETGLKQSKLQCTTTCFPVADGGDGTGELIINHYGGTRVEVNVLDPLERVITTTFGLIERGETAVIEMADASGMRLLQKTELDPLRATSFGTGQLIKAALDRNVKKIIIGLGGSATVDGGTGILKALGARFLDKEGNELVELANDLISASSVDTSKLDPRIAGCNIVVLTDVKNLLLGEQGAAKVFGPQKGADEAAVKILEDALLKFNDITYKNTGKDMSQIIGGGAAGGSAAALNVYLNATLVNGADYFLSLTNFDQALEKADVVITGEGSIDEQTMQGKAPYAVAACAKNAGVPVIGLAGKIPLISDNTIHKYFDTLIAIGNEPTTIAESMLQTETNLIRTAKNVGNLLALNL